MIWSTEGGESFTAIHLTQWRRLLLYIVINCNACKRTWSFIY